VFVEGIIGYVVFSSWQEFLDVFAVGEFECRELEIDLVWKWSINRGQYQCVYSPIRLALIDLSNVHLCLGGVCFGVQSVS